MKFLIPLLILGYLSQAFAQDYPELSVVPRASERLRIEADREAHQRWTSHLPLAVAGATTLLGGALAEGNKDRDKNGIGPKIAIGVGAGWLVTAIWLHTSYRPYSMGSGEVKSLPQGSMREQLIAERYAEERISAAASLGKKIKWISFGTNLIASMASASDAKKDSAGMAVSVAGVATSFLPLLFNYPWERIQEEQINYKKKIFGPVTFSQGLLMDPSNNNPKLGLIATSFF
jgi:hypothetical protein